MEGQRQNNRCEILLQRLVIKKKKEKDLFFFALLVFDVVKNPQSNPSIVVIL
jgi:hypothetical protein